MSVNRTKQCEVPADRVASAPYNFVPLPEKVVCPEPSADNLPNHYIYLVSKRRHTGYFDIKLVTKSPTYVRAALNRQEFDELEENLEVQKKKPFAEQVKNKPHFFSRSSDESKTDRPSPVIPGSSLRGMLRQILEVVSYSKMERVDNKRYFFRSVDTTSLGNEYSKVLKKANVCGGFLQEQNGQYAIAPCKVLTILHDDIGGKSVLFHGDKVQNLPNWNGSGFAQHKPVWVRINEGEKEVLPGNISDKNEGNGWKEARLVLTGDMPTKKREFVFLLPEVNQKKVFVSKERVIDLLHDKNQISKWQEDAFPKNRPYDGAREQDGFLLKKPTNWTEPVFFTATTNKSREMEAVFIGRAQMFRVPYDFEIHDFIPADLRKKQTIDFADAIFGYVTPRRSNARQGDIGHAYASRINVTDATYTGEGEVNWLNKSKTTIPPILASPKPTAFQHYLVQNDDKLDELKHYSSQPVKDTVLRGFKYYWHQGNVSESRLDESTKADVNSTQYTQMHPVASGAEFTFRIYFENLSDEELGALCWTLHPVSDPESVAEDCCHSLGMGKPFGMGAVKLTATLNLQNRMQRYKELFEDEKWATGLEASEALSDRAILETRTKPFEDFVLVELGLKGKYERIFQLERIAALLKMMEWPGYEAEALARQGNLYLYHRDRPNTRYMTIELEGKSGTEKNEYSKRPVLPPPSQFGDWPSALSPYNPGWATPSKTKELFTEQNYIELDQILEEDDTGPPVMPTVEAVLLTDVKKHKAQVQNVNNKTEIFTCHNMPLWMKKGNIIIAEVVRVKDEIMTAKFLQKKETENP